MRFIAIDCRDDEGDEGTQATNINELFDYALTLLWTLVTKNGWDQTKLPDISEGFSYVSNSRRWSIVVHKVSANMRIVTNTPSNKQTMLIVDLIFG